jgi:phosphomevalonate kinase
MKKEKFSSTGKVLLTGGYIILEKKYFGICIATTSKFHSIIGMEDNLEKEENVIFEIKLKSKQTNWECDMRIIEKEKELVLEKVDFSSKNIFIETSVFYCLSILYEIKKIKNKKIEIEVYGDNDFYSQREYVK